jgi:hypothetical protein
MPDFVEQVRREIMALEDGLRDAELGPSPDWFEKHVDDQMVFVADGQAATPKRMIVEAHKPGSKAPKFTDVVMSNCVVHAHSPDCAVVTISGAYTAGDTTHNLRYMRVWARKSGEWKIVAGAMY